MTKSMTALETRGLRKSYHHKDVIQGVDLHVPSGVAFGFLGPNGAGKTTVIRMLLGLTEATGGSMSVLGHQIPRDRTAALRGVGAIVEEPRFHPRMTGRENLQIHAAVLDVAAARRIPEVLDRVGLAGRARDRVGSYSLGMRQRLGIARCLLGDPQLLILDEPANGLDPSGMRELRLLVRSLVDEGRTVFLSSHLLDEVERICDMAAVIRDGRIIGQGSLDELAGSGDAAVELRVPRATEAATVLAARPDVRAAEARDDRVTLHLRGSGLHSEHQITGELVRDLVTRGFAPYAVSSTTGRLEDRVLDMLARDTPDQPILQEA